MAETDPDTHLPVTDRFVLQLLPGETLEGIAAVGLSEAGGPTALAALRAMASRSGSGITYRLARASELPDHLL